VAKHVLAPLAELPPGTQRRFAVGGRLIAVFNVAGQLRALKSACPHQGGDLAEGTVVRSVTADGPGAYAVDAERVMVKCPWHGWEFDLETGQSFCEPRRVRVKSYPVAVEHGPYRAETIPVRVEDQYVVVEL
jgi:3-phenylpropionate/trans-cinnamate dioxygenase ferredoxin subunit